MTGLQKCHPFIFQQTKTMSLFRIIGGKRVYAPKPDKYKHKKPKSNNPWSRNYDDSPEDNGGSFSQPQDYSQGYINPYVNTPNAPVFDRPSIQDNEANLRSFMADSNKPPHLQNRWKKQPSKPDFSQLSDREKCCCEPKREEFEADLENMGKVEYRYGKAYHEEKPIWNKAKQPWEKSAWEARKDGNRMMGEKDMSINSDKPRLMTPFDLSKSIDKEGIYFTADGNFLRWGKDKSLSAPVIVQIIDISGINYQNLPFNYKEFMDRVHWVYGEGGSADIVGNIDPAEYFALAIENLKQNGRYPGDTPYKDEESLKKGNWKDATNSYAKNTIQNAGKEDSPYKIFNNARTQFMQNTDAFSGIQGADRSFKAVISVATHAIRDNTMGATHWVSAPGNGNNNDTYNNKVKDRQPTVKIPCHAKYFKGSTIFYYYK